MSPLQESGYKNEYSQTTLTGEASDKAKGTPRRTEKLQDLKDALAEMIWSNDKRARDGTLDEFDDDAVKITRPELRRLIYKTIDVGGQHAKSTWIDNLKAEQIISPNPRSELGGHFDDTFEQPTNKTRYFISHYKLWEELQEINRRERELREQLDREIKLEEQRKTENKNFSTSSDSV